MLPLALPKLREDAENVLIRDLHLSTPALSGGVVNRKDKYNPHILTAEARLPSLLGVIRYWWRVAHASRYSANDLAAREKRIFGAAGSDSGGGTGLFTTQLFVHAAAVPLDKVGLGETISPELEDLLKSGLGNRNAALPEGEFGRLALTFHTSCMPEYRAEIATALDFLCAFGGIGLLSRRGLGSITDKSTLKRSVGEIGIHKVNLLQRAIGADRPSGVPFISSATQCLFWISDLTSWSDIMEFLAKRVGVLAKDFNMQPEHYFSIQNITGGRAPSPLHFNIQKCQIDQKAMSVISLLFLPTLSGGRRHEKTILATRIEKFFETLKQSEGKSRVRIFKAGKLQ